MQVLFGEKLYLEGNGSLTFLDYLNTIGNKSQQQQQQAVAAGDGGGQATAQSS